MKQPLIVLTDPTAVGKTTLSIRLVKATDGEVINAGLMQVYRHMDIGSAKVTPMGVDGVPHHLVDVLDPQKPFNAVTFQQVAKKALRGIYSHGRIPTTVGGTGFYIQALPYDIDFREDKDDSPVRRELEVLTEWEEERAPQLLHFMPRQVDPKAAVQTHANNIEHVIRAVKHFRQTGERISLHNQREREKRFPYNFFYYVPNTGRALLYERINRRVDLVVEQGLVEEVKALRDMGYRRGHTSMQGLGYKEILDYLGGRYSLKEAVYILRCDTRHFAKHQLTWFKWEGEVRFLSLPEFEGDVSKVLERILGDCAEQEIVLQQQIGRRRIKNQWI